MKFHDYHHMDTTKGGVTNHISKEEAYAAYDEYNDEYDEEKIKELMNQKNRVVMKSAQRWKDNRRPYYNIWPCVIPAFTRLNLDFPGKFITPPGGMEQLLLRFPQTNHQLQPISTMLLSFHDCTLGPEMSITTAVGSCTTSIVITRDHLRANEVFNRDLISGTEWYDWPSDKIPSDDAYLQAITLALSICLIGDDPELIEREILNSDKRKVPNATPEQFQRLVDKAIRRGKNGYNVGKDLQKIPHTRRPHPAIVWTGKGRTVPRIVLRKGSIIHRNTVSRVPTDYQDKVDSHTSIVR